MNFKEFNNYTSGSSKVELQEVQELNPSNTNINNTKLSNNKILSNHITDEKIQIGMTMRMRNNTQSLLRELMMGLEKKNQCMSYIWILSKNKLSMIV